MTSASPPSFVCPSCKRPLASLVDVYHCPQCRRDYPVLFGIADFRLRPDRFLTLDEEREKARRLHEFGTTHSLRETVAFYYSITHDLPPDMAARYQAGILAAPARASIILDALHPSPSDRLIDVGCGTGGLLVAAQGRYEVIVGVDIALRWLVVCRKRLEETGGKAELVCADAEALPFPDGMFTQVVAADLLDHVYDPQSTVRALRSQIRPGGQLWLSATNRFCIGPHPMTGVWATGYLPRRVRAWILTKLKGIDLLRFANPLSPHQVEKMLRDCGFRVMARGPKQVPITGLDDYPPSLRRAMRLYRAISRVPLLAYLLFEFGPGFELTAHKGSA